MGEKSYIEYNWAKVNNLGELRKYLQLLPDSVEFRQRIRLLQVIENDNDGRSIYVVQVTKQEDEF